MISGYKLTRFALESDLKNYGANRDASLEQFIKDMKNAKTAAQRFREGSITDKREVLQSLQSNLWLVDGNVLVDLKSSLVVLSQVNRLITMIEPRKTSLGAALSTVPSRWYAMSDAIRSHWEVRRFIESFVLCA